VTDRQTSIAILRAYLAWQKTQPQLAIDGWADMLDGLDQTQGAAALGLIEPGLQPSPVRALPNDNGTGAPACRLARPCQKGA
jgi:hypothetical protein